LVNIVRAKDGRQLSQATPTPQINLIKPIPRGLKSLCHVGVEAGLCIDVRDSPVINKDMNIALEPRDSKLIVVKHVFALFLLAVSAVRKNLIARI